MLVAAIGFPVIAFIGGATRMVMNAWMPAIAIGINVFHALGMDFGSVVLKGLRFAPVPPLVLVRDRRRVPRLMAAAA